LNKNTIKYTVSWTQCPTDWNIPNTVKILEAARAKALKLENELNQKVLEQTSFEQTQLLLQKFKLQK